MNETKLTPKQQEALNVIAEHEPITLSAFMWKYFEGDPRLAILDGWWDSRRKVTSRDG